MASGGDGDTAEVRAVVTESAGGEVSASVAETNRVRALLGAYAPLRGQRARRGGGWRTRGAPRAALLQLKTATPRASALTRRAARRAPRPGADRGGLRVRARGCLALPRAACAACASLRAPADAYSPSGERVVSGLRPLDTGAPGASAGGGGGGKGKEVAVDWAAKEAAAKAGDLRERVARARQRREVEAKFASERSLGAADGEGEGGAAAWVARSRAAQAKADEDRRAREKEQAQKVAAMLAAQDKDEDESDEDAQAVVERAPRRSSGGRAYTSRDLAGLKVTHGGGDMKEGETLVLTLKDTALLTEGSDGEMDVNEEEDELENIRKSELDKNAKAKREAAPLPKSAFVDKFAEEDEAGGAGGGVLAKYDTIIEGGRAADGGGESAARLGADGGLSAEEAARREEVRRRLAGGLSGGPGGAGGAKAAETLDSAVGVAADVFSEQEMAHFRRPKKEKKKRKKLRTKRLGASDLEAIVADEGGLPAAGEGLGSRGDGAVRRKEQAAAAKRGLAARNYETARARAESRAKALREEGREAAGKAARQDAPNIALTPEEADDEVEVDDEDELAASIARARAARAKGGPNSGAERVAERVETIKMNAEEGAEGAGAATATDALVFTSTTEFVRSIDQSAAEGITKNGSGDEAKDAGASGMAAGADVQMADVDAEEPPARGAEAAGADSAKGGNEADEEEGEVTVASTVGAGPTAARAGGRGLAGALDMLRGTGALGADVRTVVGVSGRRSDLKGEKLRVLEDRIGDASDRVRLERYDEFGRVMTPKEAWRELCHRFHGKAPGKKAQAKRLRQYREEQARLNAVSGGAVGGITEALQRANEEQQAPFQVLSGTVRAGQSMDVFHMDVEKDEGAAAAAGGGQFLAAGGGDPSGGGGAVGGWAEVEAPEEGEAVPGAPSAKRTKFQLR